MNSSVETLGSYLSRNWWLMLLRGLAAIGFGILILAKPQISIEALVYLFGIYALVDGILDVYLAIKGKDAFDDWGLLLLWGLLAIAVGVLAFTKTGVTALALLYVIALFAIVTGVLQIVAAIRLREWIQNEWWLILAGLVSVAFGVWLIVQPDKGALAVLVMISAYAIVYGLVIVIFAFRIRNFVGKVKREVTSTRAA